MRNHSLLRRTPVVFLSAQDDCDTRHQALKAGADDYVSKATSPRELLIRLELLLKRFTEIELVDEPGAGLRGALEVVARPPSFRSATTPADGGARGPPRQPVDPHRLPAGAGRLRHRPDHEGAAVVYDFIGWPNGRFEFDRGAIAEGAPMEGDVTALLLEGCRRLDERRRGRPAEAPEAVHR